MNLSPLFFFFFLLVSYVNSTNDMIEESCKTCSIKSTLFNYDFCVSSLRNSPIAPFPTNLSQLALVPLLQALDNATATTSTIHQLMDNHVFQDDNYRRACLSDCLELYEDAVERLVEGVRAYMREDRGTTNVMVSAAMENAVTCENGFEEGGRNEVMKWKSPLGGENHRLFELGEIALCLTSILSSSLEAMPF